MAQILNDAPGIGALLGTGLGQGISSGLQQLAQLKTSQLLTRHQQRQTAQGLHSLGFSPQEALQVSLLPQELQSLVIKNYLQSAENAGLEQALAGTRIGAEPATEAIGLEQLAERAESPVQRKPGLAALLGIKEPSILEKQLPSEKAFADLAGQQQVQRKSQPQISTQAKERSKENVIAPSQERNSLADILKRPRLTPEHRLKVEALQQQKELAKQRLTAKEQEAVNKETSVPYEEIQRQYKAAREGNIRLNRMEELINTGDIDGQQTIAAINHVANKIGLDLSGLLTADAQEFEKLSNDFIKNAKEFFPGRILESELKAFLKTIPTLTQSTEGRKRVIRNLRTFNEAAIIKKKASDQVITANGGRRPRDYEQQVENIIDRHLDDLAERFKRGG